MRLIEAILDANHRALAGDSRAGLHPAEFEAELPIIALSCIDVRLNPLLPEVLGVPEDQFIWLRNAGNIITGPLSSTMRSLALACAVKGGKQIVIIGHTDCQVAHTTVGLLLDRLRELGIERQHLPDNITEFFGIFSSERQNVINAAHHVRSSPIISPRVPVHGLLVDIQTGRLELLVNGYQELETLTSRWNEVVRSTGQTLEAVKSLSEFQVGPMNFPETKIGEAATKAVDWLFEKVQQMEVKTPPPIPGEKLPLPPSLRPNITLRRDKH